MNTIQAQFTFPSAAVLQLVQGDLTTLDVDAIVNAANRRLQHGGGVAGLILSKGGPEIQRESDDWVARHGPVSNAQPAYTHAGRLPFAYIIHAIGPVWGEGDEDRKLQACAQGALRLAGQLGLASLALPAISTGIFGFPKERAAGILLAAIRAELSEHTDSSLRRVCMVLYDAPTLKVFQEAWKDQIDHFHP